MAVILNGDAGVTTTSGAEYNGLQRATAVSAPTGPTITFPIPAWARRITLMLAGVSCAGSTTVNVRLGTSAGIIAAGYAGGITTAGSSVSTANLTSGINGYSTSAGATSVMGQFVVSNVSGNIWVGSGVVYRNGDTSTTYSNGFINLSANALTSISLVATTGFSPSFDAGTVNVIYE